MKKIISLGLLFLLAISVSAQEVYRKEVFISSRGDSLRYRLLRPEKEKAGKKYPLVLFLHGAGERGSDNEKQLVHGGQMFLNPVNREKYMPSKHLSDTEALTQKPDTSRPVSFVPSDMPAGQEISPIFSSLKELLDIYLSMPQVDKDRVYIIGLSMGGMGTYDMIIRFPELFAAAIPICGTVNPSRLADVKGVKFRIFHGDADNVVTVEGSRAAYRALKAAGVDVEYIICISMKNTKLYSLNIC